MMCFSCVFEKKKLFEFDSTFLSLESCVSNVGVEGRCIGSSKKKGRCIHYQMVHINNMMAMFWPEMQPFSIRIQKLVLAVWIQGNATKLLRSSHLLNFSTTNWLLKLDLNTKELGEHGFWLGSARTEGFICSNPVCSDCQQFIMCLLQQPVKMRRKPAIVAEGPYEFEAVIQ
jgi:hypothetical protein